MDIQQDRRYPPFPPRPPSEPKALQHPSLMWDEAKELYGFSDDMKSSFVTGVIMARLELK